MNRLLADAAGTERLGAALGEACAPGTLVLLRGDLGAGKTTLVRGFLRARGHAGPVKSPTYTLVESYALPGGTVHHFDLYRLADPEELEYIGIRDFFTAESICLVEWPERGAGMLPEADVDIHLQHRGAQRAAGLSAITPRGRALLAELGRTLKALGGRT